MQYPGDDIDPAMFELPGLGFFETLGMLVTMLIATFLN